MPNNDSLRRLGGGRWETRDGRFAIEPPMQRTGEKVDRATGQDKLIGTGPLEQAGRNVDRAVKDLKRLD